MEIDLVKSLNEILQVKALEEMLRAKGLTTIVDPDGDVMLELSNITLRVSSKVLSLASPVFKAMLGPNFSEGIPTETGLRTIKLPDDNSALVHYLCCILHHRYNYLEVDVDISLFQGLTLLTDKYDCVKAVQHWGINCLRKLLKEGKCHNFHLGDHPQYSRLLVPAVVFDDPEIFQEVTRLMILEFSKFYHVGYWIGDRPQALSDAPNLNITEAVQALLPADLMESMASVERRLKVALIKDIERVISPTLDRLLNDRGYPRKNEDRRRMSEFYVKLRRFGLWPLTDVLELDLQDILNKVKLVKTDFGFILKYQSSTDSRHGWTKEFKNRLEGVLEINTKFEGLCLDCLGKKVIDGAPECRVPHMSLKDIFDRTTDLDGWE